jgi:hypothetical protein
MTPGLIGSDLSSGEAELSTSPDTYLTPAETGFGFLSGDYPKVASAFSFSKVLERRGG